MHLLNRLAYKIEDAWTRATRTERDRGDVPGWVMVTVMTAILVVAILGVFEPQIKSAITNDAQ
jgi:hypothetical protein